MDANLSRGEGVATIRRLRGARSQSGTPDSIPELIGNLQSSHGARRAWLARKWSYIDKENRAMPHCVFSGLFARRTSEIANMRIAE
jgi:hypothetical protein